MATLVTLAWSWIISGLLARQLFLYIIDYMPETSHEHVQNEQGEWMHCDLCYSVAMGTQQRLDALVSWILFCTGLLGLFVTSIVLAALAHSKRVTASFEQMLHALNIKTP